MRKILILTLVLFLASCSTKQDFIYYTYNNTTVSRLDKENNIFFYYGKIKDINKLPKSYIEATYSGFDGVMDAFLIIENNGTARIIPVADLFKQVNGDNNLVLKKMTNNKDFIEWEESIKYKYLNVYRLSNSIELEIKRNKKNNSKIEAIYPDR